MFSNHTSNLISETILKPIKAYNFIIVRLFGFYSFNIPIAKELTSPFENTCLLVNFSFYEASLWDLDSIFSILVSLLWKFSQSFPFWSLHWISFELPLKWEGTFSVNLTLVVWASRTKTLCLAGNLKQDRTLLCPKI